MAISKEEYAVLVKQTAPPSPVGTDCLKAFLCGGGICALAQLGLALLQTAGLDEDTGKTVVMIALIVLTAVLTALGLFDKLAKHAGAGAAVPITGFGYALVKGTKEAIDARGWRGILEGPFSAASVGTLTAVLCGLAVSVVARSKDK